MECTHCGAELEWVDSYFTNYGRDILGDIYKCPNCEGFSSIEEAMRYAGCSTDGDLKDYLNQNGYSSWEEIACFSATFYVPGSFYTDKDGSLYEGYPC